MLTPPDVRAARLSEEGNKIHVDVFALTDVGRTREHNEDAFVVSDLSLGTPLDVEASGQQRVGDRGVLFMVADGMGGAAAGELASATAVDVVLRSLRERWSTLATRDADVFVQSLESAAETANSVIFSYAREKTELRGMGTTATIAGLLDDTLYLTQIGDSRAYIIREQKAYQITKDQSLIQKLVEAGEMTPEEAEVSERRNIILQALGPEAHIKSDITFQRVRRGDVLVLCSDGLSGQVRADEIARVLTEERELPSFCRRIIALANDLGGPDNITVVAARFDGPGLRPPNPSEIPGHHTYERLVHDVPGSDLESLLRDRTDQMMRGTPVEPFPGPVVPLPERQRAGRLMRAGLAATGVALAAWLLWRALQLI